MAPNTRRFSNLGVVYKNESLARPLYDSEALTKIIIDMRACTVEVEAEDELDSAKGS